MPTKDYTQALKLLLKHGHGLVKTSDGGLYRGALDDIESPDNDPDGIGYIMLRGEDGQNALIYENEFAELVDAW